ncbi:MAG: gluconolaconase [Roseibacillus sp.]|nr:gluconolaconase [Roseibacillus sp.]
MVEHLAGKYRAQWGEGPLWWEGKLYYVDIEGGVVVEFTPQSGEEKFWHIGERVGSVVPRMGGGFVVARDSGFAFLNAETGEVKAVGDPEPDKYENRFNDGKCSPDGRYFAGTISLAKRKGDAALYRLDPSLRIERILGGITNSNGLVWTKDGSTLFYIDTPRLSVQSFRYEATTGSLFDQREAFSTAGRVPGVPDGMTIDTEGNLWIAFCHGGCVVCFDQLGNELERIFVPCREVTAPTFGGVGLKDLYVTTGQPAEEVEENAGRLFVFSDLGAAGNPTHCFRG